MHNLKRRMGHSRYSVLTCNYGRAFATEPKLYKWKRSVRNFGLGLFLRKFGEESWHRLSDSSLYTHVSHNYGFVAMKMKPSYTMKMSVNIQRAIFLPE